MIVQPGLTMSPTVAGTFTAADLATASILHLAHTLKLLDGHPRLMEYVRRHSQRPRGAQGRLGLRGQRA